jgi:hypothetical protein
MRNGEVPSSWLDDGAREKPLCLALIICNEVIEDKRSGNKTLVSLFNSIMTAQLPASHPRMFLFASLTSGTGEWTFSFRITAPSGKEVMRMQDTARFEDPLIGHDLVVELRNLPIEEAGVYFVDLFLNEMPVANRRFTVQYTPGVAPPTPPSTF